MIKNIHIIRTDKPSRLVKNNEGKLVLAIQTLPLDKEIYCFPQNIYITSNEEIKFKEWFLDLDDNTLWQNNSHEAMKNNLFPSCKKIILTNNMDLMTDNVQCIDDEFLEWFCKNPSCKYVQITDWYNNLLSCCKSKENCLCGKKRIIIPKEDSKKETFEEAFTNYINDNKGSTLDLESANFGVKWQKEKSSNEFKLFLTEVKDKIDSFEFSVNQNSYISNFIDEWFENFKKK